MAQRKTERKQMRVPLLDLSRQYSPLREELLEALEHVLDSQQFILGTEVTAFEREAAAFIGTETAIGCGSGTDAIWLALAACDIHAGDEVLTTPFSFFATASTILRAGAKPLFVDIDPVSFNIDPEKIRARLQRARPSRLKAILPVHLYGQCADMDALGQIAAEFKLLIVEDAAQAFGAAWRGVRAGAMGAIGAFSFYPTKNLSAAGEAGCVTTSDEKLADEVRALRSHGMRVRYQHDAMGWNSRLDGFQGAVLRVKLKHIEKWNRLRRECAVRYDAMFKDAGLAGDRVGGASPLVLPKAAPQAFHIYHQYVVRAAKRDELREFLAARGIGSEVYYPTPLQVQRPLQHLGYHAESFPEAARASREVLAIPMFPELTEEEQRYVVENIAEFYS